MSQVDGISSPAELPGVEDSGRVLHCVHSMLDMQEEMNTAVHIEWQAQGYAWYRALWLECAELLEHYDWKWWRRQETDTEQLRLEVVDIWHFGLSALLAGVGRDAAAETAAAAFLAPVSSPPTVPEAAEALALDVLQSRAFSVPLFRSLAAAAGMGFDDLYARYIGKNVLNLFRQRHGYRDGSYCKQWNGREDNRHLEEVMTACDATSPDFRRRVEDALESRYRALSAAQP